MLIVYCLIQLDSFHTIANDVFKDISMVKIFLVLKLNPIYVGPPSRQHKKLQVAKDASQNAINSSLINLC